MFSSIADRNAEAAEVWAAFNVGSPIRPPVYLGTATQFFILNEDLNPGLGLTFERFTKDGRQMLEFRLRAAVWRGEHITPFWDGPIGVSERFSGKVDLQNIDEAAEFGAPVVFLPEQVPDTKPLLTLDRKTALLDTGLPDPLAGGWSREAHRVHEEMQTAITRQVKIHLCGDASCHYKTLKERLGANHLETGFPIDLGAVRKELGEAVISSRDGSILFHN
jgi:hypothetical protein